MKTSPSIPPGDFNYDWPVDDKNAFMTLVFGVLERTKRGEKLIAAAHAVAREIGLEGGEHHWMVDDMLASVFHTYYVPSSDLYADAAGFLKWAEARDLAHIGEDSVAYARVLIGLQSDH